MDGGVLGHERGVPLTIHKISKSHFTVQLVCLEAYGYAVYYNTPLTAALLNAKHTVPSPSLVRLHNIALPSTHCKVLQGSLTHPRRIKLLTDSYLQEKQITFRQWRSPLHISRSGIPCSTSVDVFVPFHISWYAKSTFLFSWRYCFPVLQHALGARWRTCALDTNTANTANL